jgi:hypothetical protein
MRTILYQWFFRSAAAMLLLTAFAKLYSMTGYAKILAKPDQLLLVNNRLLMAVMAVIEGMVAIYLFRGKHERTRALTLFWLSGNFMLYRLAHAALGLSYCACLGALGDNLPLSRAGLNVVLTALVLFWFFGSSYILWRDYDEREKIRFAALLKAQAEAQA